MLGVSKEPVSLQNPMGEEGDAELGDLVEDPNAVDPAMATTDNELAAAAREALGTLTAREEKVLRLRFGIDEKGDHTLEEVGQHFEVTRERVRQIERRRSGSFDTLATRSDCGATWKAEIVRVVKAQTTALLI